MYLFEEKDIKGVFATYQTQLNNLNMAGIGTLCVSSLHRNHGIMQDMFEDINNYIVPNNDLLYLCGDKLRYERFGFYKGGRKITYFVKHRYIKGLSDTRFAIVEYKRSVQDMNFKLCQLYMQRGNPLERDPLDYLDILKTHQAQVYLIMLGEIAGYIVYQKEKNLITEIIIDDKDLINAINSFLLFINAKTIALELAINDRLNNQLFNVCENYSVEQLLSLRIINEVNVLKCLLPLNNNLATGCLVIGGYANYNLKISVSDEIVITKTMEEADIFLNTKQLHQLFFDNYLLFNQGVKKSELLRSWFPLNINNTLATIDSI